MQVVFNAKDANTFCSASLDRTLKVWQLGSNQPNFTLEGHEKGVNCVDYYTGIVSHILFASGSEKTLVINLLTISIQKSLSEFSKKSIYTNNKHSK